ncbi:MFS transporter (macronuclear) [Tetrahymena thermophila SB210]|uniref:Lysosomal dipeptide transporter MFSD1 n=1 Tax=Tetrahymena thermophila (strain SB210) TaxID=312017 RepID=Q22XS3_TETTS|nr:MFS transporter [Tetrahymena thermophila SB210]EAR90098.2 MFS transporter [Tetrahymena thermophila SB210]|eukprot:XP_001010343.2 MFS transporter [Tetrahymena thermophila SB210]
MSEKEELLKVQPLLLDESKEKFSTNSTASIILPQDIQSSFKETISQNEQINLENKFIDQKRLWMLPFISTVLFGAFYNQVFQSGIKEQLVQSMGMSSFQYQMFVLIPTLPSIPLSLIIGPALDTLGARNGLILSSCLLVISMVMCTTAGSLQSFGLLISGKILLAISSDSQTIAQGCILGKWYRQKGLARTFTINSLFCKVASSISGILYPMLYDKSNGLFLPFLIGMVTCLFSLVSSIFIFALEKKADFYEKNLQNKNQIQKYKFKLSDFKKFYGVYWCFAILSPLTFGAFIAIQNYLQSVLIHKFQIDKTLAGEMLSIPYYIAYLVPLLGIMADKFGQRLIMMIVTSSFAVLSFLLLLIAPQGYNSAYVWIALVIFGLFLSLMSAYLYPTLPFITQKNLLSTGFGVAFTTRGAYRSFYWSVLKYSLYD